MDVVLPICVALLFSAGIARGQAVGVEASACDCGARADGKTDCAAGIQRAIDRVSKTGGRVVLPPAPQPYVIRRSLVIAADNVELVGHSATIRLADGAGSNKTVDCLEIRGTKDRPVTNVAVRGLTIDANYSGQANPGNSRGIDCDWATRVLIENVTIRRPFVGLTFGLGVTHSEARDCHVVSSYDDGFNASGDCVTDGCHHVTFLRCRVSDSPGRAGDSAWEIEDGCSDVVLIDCVAENVNNSAFHIRSHARQKANDTRRIVFVRCRATGFEPAGTGRGWHVRGWDHDITAGGVTLIDCQTDGVCVFANGVRDVTIINGQFTGKVLVGIYHVDVTRKIDPKKTPHQARDVTIQGARIDTLRANLSPAIGTRERYQPTLSLVRTKISKRFEVQGDRTNLLLSECQMPKQ